MPLTPLLLAAAIAAPAPSPPECFDGTIGVGPRTRRIIVELGDPPAPAIHHLGRPPRTFALIRRDGTDTLASADGQWSVTLAGGQSATVTRAGVQATVHRALAVAESASVTGAWEGVVGPGGVIRLAVRIVTGPCGLLVGWLDSPDQGQRDLPFTAIAVRGDSLVLHAAYFGLRLSLPLLGGDEREARLVQPNVDTPVLLRRGAGLATIRRPQDPVPPFPYAESEFRVAGGAPGIRLEGTLTVPGGPGPHPAILLISGSGAQDRDETVAGHRPFLVLADRLARAGYAVLRMDDRGIGGSTGDILQAGIHELAGDVRAALAELRRHPALDAGRIGLLGHSEGGYVAQLVAADDPAVAFLVLLGAPAAPGRDVLLAQRALLGRAGGASADAVRVDSLMVARIFEVLDATPSPGHLPGAVDSALTRWLGELSPADRAVATAQLAERSAAQDSASIHLWSSRWFQSLFRHDPAPSLRRIRVPTWVAIGTLDLQVPAAQNLPAYEAAFVGERRALLTVDRPEGVNHLMQPATTGRMEEYVSIAETIAPPVLEGLLRWLANLGR